MFVNSLNGGCQLNNEKPAENTAMDDAETLCEIVNCYKDSLCRFLWKYLTRHDLVEDVFQETIMQVFVSRDRFDSSKPLSPWLFTIAANKAKDELRKQRIRPAVNIGSLSDSWEASFDSVLNTITTYDTTPHDDVEKKEAVVIVNQIIADMPEKAREILLLVYFNKYSYKQTAEILAIPIGTVKSRLHAAVVYFAKLYKMSHVNQELTPFRQKEVIV